MQSGQLYTEDENSTATQHYQYRSNIFAAAEQSQRPSYAAVAKGSVSQSTLESNTEDQVVHNQASTTAYDDWTVIEHDDLLQDVHTTPLGDDSTTCSTVDCDSEHLELENRLKEAIRDPMTMPVLVPDINMTEIALSTLSLKDKEPCPKKEQQPLQPQKSSGSSKCSLM